MTRRLAALVLAVVLALFACGPGGRSSASDGVPPILRALHAPNMELAGDWVIAWERGFVNGHLRVRPVEGGGYALDYHYTTCTGGARQSATGRFADGALRRVSEPAPPRTWVRFPELFVPVRFEGADYLVPLEAGQEFTEPGDEALALCTGREEHAFHRATPQSRR